MSEKFKRAGIGKKVLIVYSTLFCLVAIVLILIGNIEIKKAVNAAIEEKAKTDISTLSELLNTMYPGDWRIENNELFKGELKLNDNFDIVDKFGSLTGNTITIFQGDTRITTNVMKEGKRATGTKASEEVIKKTLENGEMFIGEAVVVDNKYQTAYVPIKDKDGNKIGMFYTGVSKTMLEKMIRSAATHMTVIGIICLIIVWLYPAYSQNQSQD